MAYFTETREELQAQAKAFFDNFENYPAITEAYWTLQLPYANKYGNPICVDISWHEAKSLCQTHGTHRFMRAGQGCYVVTPIVPAQHMVFQLGAPAL